MAEQKIARIHLVGKPNPPEQPTPTNTKEIASEVLTVVGQCAKALRQHCLDTEIALGEITGLLDYLQIIALRGIAKGGAK